MRRTMSAADVSHVPIANPIGALFAVLGAAAVAVALVPPDYAVAGALRPSALILAIGLLGPVALKTFRQPVAAFRVEHLIMLGLVYWLLLDEIQGAYALEAVSEASVASAFGAVGIFAAGVWIAALHRPWGLPAGFQRAARANLSSPALFGALVLATGIALFRYAWPCRFDPVLMVTSLSRDRWSAPWSRAQGGGWGAFIDHLSYFGYLVPTLTVILAHRTGRWLNVRVVVGCILSAVVTAFLAHGGSRRVIGVTLGAALISWVLARRRRVRLATLVVPAVGAAVVLIVMQIILEYRGTGYSGVFDGDVNRTYKHLHVDDNFLRLAQVIEFVPERHPYVYEKVFIWVLIRPVPRAIWPSKPVDPGFDLTRLVGKGGASLSMSALGELYLSFGWAAVLGGGWLFGRLAGTCTLFVNTGDSPARILMYSVGAMAVFTGLRSLIELILMSYILLAWYAVVVLLKLPAIGSQPTPFGTR